MVCARSVIEPEYPCDLEELKQIERLLQKIPLYKKKIEGGEEGSDQDNSLI